MPGYQIVANSPSPFKRGDEALLAKCSNATYCDVIIDAAAVDAQNPEGTSILRAGLLLARIDATNKYVPFANAATNGSENEENCVLLTHRVEMVAGQDALATCLDAGTHVKREAVIFASAAEEAAFVENDARLIFKP